MRIEKVIVYYFGVMPRQKLPEDEKLVLQGLRISPLVKVRLDSLPSRQKRKVIAKMREAAERVVIRMVPKPVTDYAENI